MRIAIVGGGAAGAITTIHLLRRLQAGARIDLFEPRAEIGRGIAYADQPGHFLLNVPASSMFWTDAEGNDFSRWLEAEQTDQSQWREADGSAFLPRALFGQHLGQVLRREIAASKVIFHHHRSLVRHISCGDDGLRLQADGVDGTLAFSHAVVTIGNAPPANLPVGADAGAPRVLQSAWDITTADIRRDDQVVIVGAGLTMADCLAELEARGHRGQITCVSRNGRSPREALGLTPPFTPAHPPCAATASAFFRAFRLMVSEARRETGDWRPAFAFARVNAASLWRQLDRREQDRLRRHARAFWDIHRYMMPPAAARRMQALEASGRLRRVAAHALGIGTGGLRIRQQGADRLIPADLVINAAGFDSSYKTAPVPPAALLELTQDEQRSLPRRGLAVDDLGRLQIEANNGRIFALGHLVRADHGELGTISAFGAVAQAIAGHLAQEQDNTP